jgi:hypothetical protein
LGVDPFEQPSAQHQPGCFAGLRRTEPLNRVGQGLGRVLRHDGEERMSEVGFLGAQLPFAANGPADRGVVDAEIAGQGRLGSQGVVSDDRKVRDTLGAQEWRRGSQYRGSRVTPVEGLAHSKGAS